jgi:hypothetical protein
MTRVRITTWSMDRRPVVEERSFEWAWLAHLFAIVAPLLDIGNPYIIVEAEVLS